MLSMEQMIRMIDTACDDDNKEIYDLGKRGYSNPLHEHVEIEHNGETICIDVMIYPLMKLLWEKGIETSACCQGDEQRKGYISFKSKDHIIKFCEEFTYFQTCEFDILNIYSKPLSELTYDVIKSHHPYYADLYSVRFDHDILIMFQ